MMLMIKHLYWFLLVGCSLSVSVSYAAELIKSGSLQFTSTEPEELKKIEKISVVNNVRINTLDDVFTSDNTLVFPDQTLSLDRTVADVIAQTEGIELNGQGGLLQSYNIRGFSRDRIKTFVNGIPIITDRSAGNSVSFIPTALVNSLYLQKGPSSSLYGSGAMGGVVSLSTVGDANKLSAEFEPKSHQVAAQYANAYLNVGAVHRTADNPVSSNNTELNNHYKQSAMTVSAEYAWDELYINASSVFSYGKDIGKSAITFPDTRVSVYPQDKHLLSKIEFSNHDSWKLQVFQHAQQWQSEVTRKENDQTIRRNLTQYSSDTFGINASYAVNQTKLGVDWYTRQNIEIVEQEFNTENTLQWAHLLVAAHEQNTGLYINHVWLVDNFSLTAGGRIDYVSLSPDNNVLLVKSTNKTAFSGSIASHYQLSNNTHVKVEIASSFRFPTVSELLFSGETPRGLTIGNPNLKSEESMGYQLSFSHQFSPTLHTNLSTYYYDINDYIERITLNDESKTYQNSENVKIKGIEFNTTWQPSKQFNTSVGMQWQQGKNQLNETVDDGLPSAIKWAFEWRPVDHYFDRFSVSNSINYRFNRTKVGSSETELADVLLWNLAINYTLVPKVELSLVINNMLNKNYRASADEDAPFQPERTGIIKFKWFY